MFDLDKWEEIWQTMKKHKLRTLLTSFGVFWGIFMLVILLGAGKGLHNGVVGGWSLSKNAFFIWTQVTSMPYAGFQPGRKLQLTNEDIGHLKKLKEVGAVSPRLRLRNNNVEYDNRKYNFFGMGDYPDWTQVETMRIGEGRFINPLDIKEKRKVVVVGRQVKNMLFQEKDAIGEVIAINGISFTVVGVFDPKDPKDVDGTQYMHLPLTTVQNAFSMPNQIDWLGLTPASGYSNEEAEAAVRADLKYRHKVHPDDRAALGGWSAAEEYKKTEALFTGIAAFSWLVAIGTILAGMVGVGNIMLIIVKERTKEIGIRKALGAKPWSIIGMIIFEAIVLAGFSGYLGLLAGVGIIEALDYAMKNFGIEVGMFRNPEIDFSTAIISILVLLVSGVLAGLFPGVKAAKVDPVVALRDE
jgi:putative ABC transport system permease protein